jgi:hypothetical protein
LLLLLREGIAGDAKANGPIKWRKNFKYFCARAKSQ